MDSSKHFASNIAPYAPPPDQPDPDNNATSSNGNHPRASWFQKPAGIVNAAVNSVNNAYGGGYSSYQSGAIPTLAGGDQAGITGFGSGGRSHNSEEGGHNLWETRFGWRIDVEAAFAYLLGPVSGECLLY